MRVTIPDAIAGGINTPLVMMLRNANTHRTRLAKDQEYASGAHPKDHRSMEPWTLVQMVIGNYEEICRVHEQNGRS